jgi:hypothetical protein
VRQQLVSESGTRGPLSSISTLALSSISTLALSSISTLALSSISTLALPVNATGLEQS